MSTPCFIPMPGNEEMAARLAHRNGGTVIPLELHTFPDGEVRPRLLQDVFGHSVALVCSMDRANEKFLPLAFTAAGAREQGARNVGLVAPYLGYMRQDKCFHPGEAITSHTFARLISGVFDWLATVDPHLHRTGALGDIFSIPSLALHAGPDLAAWIQANVLHPFLIGPDEESRQWVAGVAQQCAAPFTIMEKERLGDRSVKATIGRMSFPKDATLVLLDDIIASGTTMLESIRLLQPLSHRAPIILAIHGVFANGTEQALRQTGALLVTSTSVTNTAATVEIDGVIASGIAGWMR